MKTLKQFLFILSRKNKIDSIFLFFFILLSVFFEMIGIGLIIPLLTTLSDVGDGGQNNLFNLSSVFNFVGYEKNLSKQNIISISVIFLTVIYFIKTIFLNFLAWFQSKYINNLVAEIKFKLFKRYMFQDYTFHLQRNSSKLIQNVINEIELMINVFFLSLITFTSELFVVFGISIILIFVEPLGFLMSMILFGITSIIFFLYTKKKVKKYGEKRLTNETLSIKNLQQGIDGIKAIKVAGVENNFLDYFKTNIDKIASVASSMLILQTIPRYYLEFLAVISLAGLIFFLLFLDYTFNSLLVIVGLFAAASFKILPSVNRILSSFVNMRYGLASVEVVYNDLKLNVPKNYIDSVTSEKLLLKSRIELENINFKYPNTDKFILKNLNLIIDANSMIGIVGKSGSGKTTLVDLIIGILNPTDGKILVDKKDMIKTKRAWQNNVGYIPQLIYLLDDTIKINIALSGKSKNIDDQLISKAMHLSNSSDFINKLPMGVETTVGEFGVRLSGGQKQRVGIARALYNEHDLLVFDEATSSLDEETEKEIIKTINSMKSKKTIIICSHKKEILEKCDKIYKVENQTIEKIN
tara:strand:- start:1004 stop:2746 length:1743 start_codon:yes stop_codon:yes gene_type:complete